MSDRRLQAWWQQDWSRCDNKQQSQWHSQERFSQTAPGVIINNSQNDTAEEAIHLGTNATVFFAEIFAVEGEASHFIHAENQEQRICHFLRLPGRNSSF